MLTRIAIALTLAATVLNGCVCTVHVTEDEEWDGPRGPRDGRGMTNGGEHVASVEVLSTDGTNETFPSVTAITPRKGQSVRMRVTSADAAPVPPCEPNVFPDFNVHYEPDAAAENVEVHYDSPPYVSFFSGWLYFKGKAPIGKTRRVRAIGSGTEMLIEIAADADYVYVLGEATSTVLVFAVQPDGSEVECGTISVGQYIKVADVEEDGHLVRRCTERDSYGDVPARIDVVTKAVDKVEDDPWP